MSVDLCPRCPGKVWNKGYDKVGCDECGSVWLTYRDYKAELEGGVKDKPGYLGNELKRDLHMLVQTTRATTMREVGGHLMNAYEKTDEKFRGMSASRARDKVEGELGALKAVMEFLSGWSDKVMEEAKSDDSKP